MKRNPTGINRLTLNFITDTVASFYGIYADDLTGRSRPQLVADARHFAFLLGREYTSCTLVQIGQYFGGRDHATVIHGVSQAKTRMDLEIHVRRDFEALAFIVRQWRRNQGWYRFEARKRRNRLMRRATIHPMSSTFSGADSSGAANVDEPQAGVRAA